MAGLYINHNLMALTASRNLGVSYSKLSSSINKLSSGLRINSAADDAAGLAVRELMRSDIAVLNQGVRNANDAISMLQTMDGAAQVIDEKLIRMKELAEQAATGTYNDQQRSIMNSEFSQMRSEIERIANATDFNGVKMLNVTSAGTQEVLNAAGDANAFGSTQAVASAFTGFTAGSVTVSYTTHDGTALTGTVSVTGKTAQVMDFTETATSFASTQALSSAFAAFTSGSTVSVNFTTHDGTLISATASVAVTSSTTITNFLSSLNAITSFGVASWTAGTGLTITDATSGVSQLGVDLVDSATHYTASTTTSGTNNTTISGFMAELSTLTSFGTASWTSGSGLSITDTAAGTSQLAASFTEGVSQYDFATGTAGVNGNVKIHFGTGNDPTEDYYYVNKQDMTSDGLGINTLDISTQPGAQGALTTIDSAILAKDQARAHFGAMMNRLSNTVSNLSLQAENVQAAESQVSDVDVATEMTKFVNSQIKSQAAVAMLAQANTLPQMALTLIGGR